MKKVGLLNIFHVIMTSQLVINFLRYFIGFFATTQEEMVAVKQARIFHAITDALVEMYGVDKDITVRRMENVEGMMELTSIIITMVVVGLGNSLFGDLKDQRDQALKDAESAKKAAEKEAAEIATAKPVEAKKTR